MEDAGHGRDWASVDTVTEQWRQEDFVLSEQWFISKYTPGPPATVDRGGGHRRRDRGRARRDRRPRRRRALSDLRHHPILSIPSVGLSPYRCVEVDERSLREIQRGRRPQYAYLPAAHDQRLVGDLDRVMTVEKAVLMRWQRQEGCASDEEARRLALALSRKRTRFAFPDDFVAWGKKLQNRLQEKHDQQSDEGRALRALREIRVRAAPAWDADQIELMFWFIRSEEEPTFEGKSWSDLLEMWMRLLTAGGRFDPVYGGVTTLDDLTAREYVRAILWTSITCPSGLDVHTPYSSVPRSEAPVLVNAPPHRSGADRQRFCWVLGHLPPPYYRTPPTQ